MGYLAIWTKNYKKLLYPSSALTKSSNSFGWGGEGIFTGRWRISSRFFSKEEPWSAGANENLLWGSISHICCYVTVETWSTIQWYKYGACRVVLLRALVWKRKEPCARPNFPVCSRHDEFLPNLCYRLQRREFRLVPKVPCWDSQQHNTFSFYWCCVKVSNRTTYTKKRCHYGTAAYVWWCHCIWHCVWWVAGQGGNYMSMNMYTLRTVTTHMHACNPICPHIWSTHSRTQHKTHTHITHSASTHHAEHIT